MLFKFDTFIWWWCFIGIWYFVCLLFDLFADLGFAYVMFGLCFYIVWFVFVFVYLLVWFSLVIWFVVLSVALDVWLGLFCLLINVTVVGLCFGVGLVVIACCGVVHLRVMCYCGCYLFAMFVDCCWFVGLNMCGFIAFGLFDLDLVGCYLLLMLFYELFVLYVDYVTCVLMRCVAVLFVCCWLVCYCCLWLLDL